LALAFALAFALALALALAFALALALAFLLPLGGAAVHRCDKETVLIPASAAEMEFPSKTLIPTNTAKSLNKPK